MGDCHCSNGFLVLIFLVSYLFSLFFAIGFSFCLDVLSDLKSLYSYKESMFLMFRSNLKNFGVSSFTMVPL